MTVSGTGVSGDLLRPERVVCNLLYSLENFPSISDSKFYKIFSGSLEFRGWTAGSTECQVRRVDRWVGPMSDCTRNGIAPEMCINF
ncbi:ORF1021 [White spot syndrome virus]|uniref:ORF1021 n=1 Tax=White spot syndrome virus TaxID=342409 RepID=A0A2D3I5U6_9VIRU|nr:ORF1021 [White spot syndrome virus]